MSFFEPVPEPPEWMVEEPPPRRRRWRGTADDTLGQSIALSALLAQTDEVAVLVSGFVAFPVGFSFSLVAISRTGAGSVSMWSIPPQATGEPEFLRLGLQFSNGQKATNLGGHFHPPFDIDDFDNGEPALSQNGGGGGGQKWSQRYVCHPLPPEGPLAFVVAWPVNQIEETRTELDATPIREAGLAARPLWEDDVDYQEVGEPDDLFD